MTGKREWSYLRVEARLNFPKLSLTTKAKMIIKKDAEPAARRSYGSYQLLLLFKLRDGIR